MLNDIGYKIPKSGYIGSFSISNIPILIHWTFPVGGIFAAFWLGNQTLISFLALIAAYTTMIITHEIGHALAARMYSSKVLCILVTAAGGWCFISEEPRSFSGRMLFHGGGIIAQLVLFLSTMLLIIIFGSPQSIISKSFIFIFIFANPILMVMNLIPAKNNDGMQLLTALKDRNNA